MFIPSVKDATRSLYEAIRNNHEQAVEYYLQCDADLAAIDEQSNRDALQLACSLGHTEIVELLLSYGADPDSPGSVMMKPLEEGAYAGHMHVVEQLLGDGAKIRDGRSGPLYLAAARGHHQIVFLLIQNKAVVNSKAPFNAHGNPLVAAAHGGHVTTVYWLLLCGANPNGVDYDYVGGYPLIEAAMMGREDIVAMLLQEMPQGKARIDQLSPKTGETALEGAKKGGYTQVVQVLRNLGAKEYRAV